MPKNTKVMIFKITQSIKIRRTTNNCISWAWRIYKPRADLAEILFAVDSKTIVDIFEIEKIIQLKNSTRKRVIAHQISDPKLRNKYIGTILPVKFQCRYPVLYNYSFTNYNYYKPKKTKTI
jgi:hypothetical protein